MALPSYNCPNCGAPLDTSSLVLKVATCPFCKSIFRVHDTLTPEPTLGDLLLGADFSRKPIPGWLFLTEENVRLLPGPPPELVGKYPAGELVHHLVRTSGLFDDVDVSVTIRLLDSVEGKLCNAGLFTRYSSGRGAYGVFISSNQRFQIGYYQHKDKALAWTSLVPWNEHHALRGGFNQPNRLRMVMRGKRMSVYLNGVLATSIENDLFQNGEIRLSIETLKDSHMEASFSDLQVRAA